MALGAEHWTNRISDDSSLNASLLAHVVDKKAWCGVDILCSNAAVTSLNIAGKTFYLAIPVKFVAGAGLLPGV